MSLRPGESLEFCGRQDQIDAAQNATGQWLEPLGRNNHIQVNPCNSNSTLRINITALDRCVGAPACNIQQYFSGNSSRLEDGTIEINQRYVGSELQAFLLHELGHSFGLCDQYKDKSSAGCQGGAGAPRQNNDEIMGATNSRKQTLTQGDIDALYRAEAINVRSAQAWEQYSGTPSQSTQQGLAGTNGSQTTSHTLNAGDGYIIQIGPTTNTNTTTQVASSPTQFYQEVVANQFPQQPLIQNQFVNQGPILNQLNQANQGPLQYLGGLFGRLFN